MDEGKTTWPHTSAYLTGTHIIQGAQPDYPTRYLKKWRTPEEQAKQMIRSF